MTTLIKITQVFNNLPLSLLHFLWIEEIEGNEGEEFIGILFLLFGLPNLGGDRFEKKRFKGIKFLNLINQISPIVERFGRRMLFLSLSLPFHPKQTRENFPIITSPSFPFPPSFPFSPHKLLSNESVTLQCQFSQYRSTNLSFHSV